MFSKQQQQPALPFVEKIGVNPILSLQRYYNKEQAHESRKIQIRMEDEEEEEEEVIKEAIEQVTPQQETTDWDQDPLRLCLPSTPKIPPPVILPSELYEPSITSPHNDKAPPPAWLYERDPELATSMTSFDTETITDETWEAIFHPLSTFKHKQGELEYLAWNPSNLPAAAARVAYRVMHARAFAPESDTVVSDVEPTIPTLMPSPPLKPSPVLSEEPKEQVIEDQGYYYDMLKNIRGEPPITTPTTEIKMEPPRIAKRSLLDLIVTKKQDNQYMMEEETPVTTQAMMMKDPEMCSDEKNRYWTEKKLFWFGFLCPLLWFYGSYYIRAARKSKDPTNLIWQRKCRLASIYFSVIVSVIVLVAVVKAAGSAGVRQAQSGTIRAVIAN